MPDDCSMFNYFPAEKRCQLLYKGRPGEYKVKKKRSCNFRTHMCLSSPCGEGGQCYSLSVAANQKCSCKPGYNGTFCNIKNGKYYVWTLLTTAPTTQAATTTSAPTTHAATTTQAATTTAAPTGPVKANSAPVCIGAKDDAFGTFIAPKDGNIKTFKLVHTSGGVSYSALISTGKWGTRIKALSPGIELFVTDDQKNRIAPPPNYPLISNFFGVMKYSISGYNVDSPYIILPEISPPLAVTQGKVFQIWFGDDFANKFEFDNVGPTLSTECIQGSKVFNVPFSDSITNHTIVGPVMSTVTTIDERACEVACFMAMPDDCSMFNYFPAEKRCQLLYKGRPGEYKVKKKRSCNFRTHMVH
ncbi:hypothetical protein QZH41_013665 [Actinostola sp. cb2023]|nr:hypothetical protein QZH41_013665 [Actinostola sp. cb2023]